VQYLTLALGRAVSRLLTQLDPTDITMEPHRLDKQKHLKYWLRCLKVYLPSAYSSLDSNRMMLVYFTMSALDLLGFLFSNTTEAERESYKTWIYHCQHPDGGFRGGHVSNLDNKYNDSNKAWDPASVPSTYFAIASLLMLRDDLSRVRKTECLQWLKTVQRPDGSFGQTLGEGGKFEGGFDTRFGYTATGIWWMLEGGRLPLHPSTHKHGLAELDLDALVKNIASLQVSHDTLRLVKLESIWNSLQCRHTVVA
jgi:geranylgeranyl transferase type-1 subunit beta